MVGVRRIAREPALVERGLAPRHFLDIDQLDNAELRGILDVATRLQKRPARPPARRQDLGDDL